MTSLSKAASPSLRMGAIIARRPVAGRLLALRAVDDLFVSRPLQETALELVEPAVLRAAPQGPQPGARSAGATLGQAVGPHLPAASITLPAGGMHLWAGLPLASTTPTSPTQPASTG